MKKCEERTEVWARVVGFFRPVQHFNRGQKQQFHDRPVYAVEKGEKVT